MGAPSLAAHDNRFLQVDAAAKAVLWTATVPGVPNSLSSLRVVHRGLSTLACTVETSAVVTGALADYVGGTSGNGNVLLRVRCNAGRRTSFYTSTDLIRVSY